MRTSLRSWMLVSLCLGAGALIAGRSVGATSIAAQDTDAGPSRHRLECFELRCSPDGPAVGYASLHRADSESSTSLEWQIHFPGDELHVWHTESRDRTGRRWIWREAKGRRTRSVIAEQRGAELEVTEWGRPCVWRAKLCAGESSAFPLELEERLRHGEIPDPLSEPLALFDPLSNEVDAVQLKFRDQGLASSDDLRQVEIVREDGSLAGSWTFHGDELVSFAWQRGGLFAVRVEPERVAQLVPTALETTQRASLSGQR